MYTGNICFHFPECILGREGSNHLEYYSTPPLAANPDAANNHLAKNNAETSTT